jgi:hypothetical protein
MPTDTFSLASQERHFSMSELRVRGWSGAMVAGLLGAHDAEQASAERVHRPRRLWSAGRVYLAEIEPSFSERKAQKIARAERSLVATHASALQLVAIAQSVTISLENAPEHYVEASRAIAERHGVAEFVDDAGLVLGWECLAVEHLMQALEPVFEVLDVHVGQPGIRQARTALSVRLLKAIGVRYPKLLQECERRCALCRKYTIEPEVR